jgi:osmotically inducible protein OsmC
MATERRAEAVWQGDLTNGSGTILSTTSGALPQLDVSWAARTEDAGGKTSPEDLIAAAWASCFAMALSNVLAKGGNAPEKLETAATVTFQPGQGITRGVLTVHGTVPGISDHDFHAAAEDAKVNCPVSKALTGVPDVQVEASLAA